MPPAVYGEWLSSRRTGSESSGSIRRSSASASVGLSTPEQVGGVVGIHGLEHVGGAFGVELTQQFGLVVLGQLLQDVGQSLVVEGLDHLGAAFGREVAQGVGHLDGALALELVQQLGHALARHRQSRRGQALTTFCQSTTTTVERRPSRRRLRTATRVTSQSRVRVCSIPRSTTTTSTPVQLRLLGVVDPDPGVEHLTQHQHLTGALGEPAQRHVAGVERDGVRFDRGDPQNRNENPSPRG